MVASLRLLVSFLSCKFHVDFVCRGDRWVGGRKEPWRRQRFKTLVQHAAAVAALHKNEIATPCYCCLCLLLQDGRGLGGGFGSQEVAR